MPYKNYIYEYYAKISSGEIIVGKWIKKIFEIIINGLQTQEYFFNAKAANKAIKFIETFCQYQTEQLYCMAGISDSGKSRSIKNTGRF